MRSITLAIAAAAVTLLTAGIAQAAPIAPLAKASVNEATAGHVTKAWYRYGWGWRGGYYGGPGWGWRGGYYGWPGYGWGWRGYGYGSPGYAYGYPYPYAYAYPYGGYYGCPYGYGHCY